MAKLLAHAGGVQGRVEHHGGAVQPQRSIHQNCRPQFERCPYGVGNIPGPFVAVLN
ncbi:hypothetical protein [Tellurirhabdus bombi]|uniref:hypothetical protein n=1 Tax=Tellurirhabdus bombi TaxID=2907205 RepID=UPI001F239118|nr:hypothetical protein [Tellurirhabdus bombi]